MTTSEYLLNAAFVLLVLRQAKERELDRRSVIVPLLLIARRRDVMGSMVNPGWLTAIASVLGGLIIALNVFLLQQVFFA